MEKEMTDKIRALAEQLVSWNPATPKVAQELRETLVSKVDTAIRNLVEDAAPNSQPLADAAKLWRPIESAPKDGTIVRLWLVPIQHEVSRPRTGAEQSNNVFGCYAHDENGWWSQDKQEAYERLGSDITWAGWQGSFGPSKYRPTRWMPLPPAPPVFKRSSTH